MAKKATKVNKVTYVDVNDPIGMKAYRAYQDSSALYNRSNQARVDALLRQGFKYDTENNKKQNYLYTEKEKKDHQKSMGVNPNKDLQKIIQSGNNGRIDQSVGGQYDTKAQSELMHGKIAPIGIAPLYDSWWRTSPTLTLENDKPNPNYGKPFAKDLEGKVIRNFFSVPIYKKPTQPVKVKPTYENYLKTVNPDYLGPDYNLEEAYKNLPYDMMQDWAKDPEKNHLPDTYKLPNHPTFSNESIYYKPGMKAGRWEGENYIPIPADTIETVMPNTPAVKESAEFIMLPSGVKVSRDAYEKQYGAKVAERDMGQKKAKGGIINMYNFTDMKKAPKKVQAKAVGGEVKYLVPQSEDPNKIYHSRKKTSDASFGDYASDIGRFALKQGLEGAGLQGLVKDTYKTEAIAKADNAMSEYVQPVATMVGGAVLDKYVPGLGTGLNTVKSTLTSATADKTTERKEGETDAQYSRRLMDAGYEIDDLNAVGLKPLANTPTTGLTGLIDIGTDAYDSYSKKQDAKAKAEAAAAAEKKKQQDEANKKAALGQSINAMNSAELDATNYGYANGGEIKGAGTGTSDSIKAKVKPGSFVVPAENSEIAKSLRKKYLSENNEKANLKQGGGVDVKLSNGEHLFTPKEKEKLESKGIALSKLAPNAEENVNKYAEGGTIGMEYNRLANELKTAQSERQPKERIRYLQTQLDIAKRYIEKNGPSEKIDGNDKWRVFSKGMSDYYKKETEKKSEASSKSTQQSTTTAETTAPEKSMADKAVPKAPTTAKAPATTTTPKTSTAKAPKTATTSLASNAAAATEPMLLDEKGYKAIDAFENSKGSTQGTSMNKGDGYSKTKEKEISDYVKNNIGMDVWNRMSPKLKMQTYSWMFNHGADDSVLKGLAHAADYDAMQKLHPGDTDESRRALTKQEALDIIKKADLSSDKVYNDYKDQALKQQYQSLADNYDPTKGGFDEGQSIYKKSWENRSTDLDYLYDGKTPPTTPANPNDSKEAPATTTTTPPPTTKEDAKDRIGENILAAGQMGYGLYSLIKDGKMPVDKIDPEVNKAIARAEQDAMYGYDMSTKSQLKSDLESSRIGLVNLATQSAGGDAMQANALARAATNQYSKGLAELASNDTTLQMQKKGYRDNLVMNRAAMNRQLYQDKLNAFNMNQETGAQLLGAGITNFYTNRRMDRQMKMMADAEASGKVTFDMKALQDMFAAGNKQTSTTPASTTTTTPTK